MDYKRYLFDSIEILCEKVDNLYTKYVKSKTELQHERAGNSKVKVSSTIYMHIRKLLLVEIRIMIGLDNLINKRVDIRAAYRGGSEG